MLGSPAHKPVHPVSSEGFFDFQIMGKSSSRNEDSFSYLREVHGFEIVDRNKAADIFFHWNYIYSPSKGFKDFHKPGGC